MDWSPFPTRGGVLAEEIERRIGRRLPGVELLLEFVFEILLELVFSAIGEAALRKSHRPVVGAISSVVLGALVGIASYWLWPHHFLVSQTARTVNLVFAPLFVGTVLGLRGYLTAQPRFLVKSAVNGVLLAGTIGLIRHLAIG